MITNLAGLWLPLLLQSAVVQAPTQTAADAAAVPASDAATAAGTAQAVKITDKNHPDYVRCRSEQVIGSLAKRKKTCLTNREWEEIARTGNRGTRDIVDSQQVGMNPNQ